MSYENDVADWLITALANCLTIQTAFGTVGDVPATIAAITFVESEQGEDPDDLTPSVTVWTEQVDSEHSADDLRMLTWSAQPSLSIPIGNPTYGEDWTEAFDLTALREELWALRDSADLAAFEMQQVDALPPEREGDRDPDPAYEKDLFSLELEVLAIAYVP